MPSSASLFSPVVTYALDLTLVGIVGVWVTYYLMCRVFPLKHSTLVWWCYFIVRGFVHGYLTGEVALNGNASFEPLVAIETSVSSILSLLLVLYMWEGDLVVVALCAVLSDTFAGTFAVFCRVLANILVGLPADRGWAFALDPATALDVVLRILIALALAKPITGLLRSVGRMAMRHHLLASYLVAAFIVYTVVELCLNPNYKVLGFHYLFVDFLLWCILLGMGILTAWQAYDVSRRQKALDKCMSLVGDYDQRVRAHLATLEEYHTAFDGHERSLARLREAEGDADVARRIQSLEQTYRSLCEGNYCDQPALDAVLTSCARRLGAAGVRCDVTVAGLSTASASSAMMAFTMMGMVADAAERSRSKEGKENVELRVRGMGDRVLLHMDVPASWGRLRARRLLAPFCDDEVKLVSERRRGARTLVLVMMSEVG